MTPDDLRFIRETQPEVWERAQKAGREVVAAHLRSDEMTIPDDVHGRAVAARDELLQREARWYG